jgi:hypothetical protein
VVTALMQAVEVVQRFFSRRLAATAIADKVVPPWPRSINTNRS